ncbi:MAG: hypothetical protein ACT4PP_05750 [Sporichthyaceae bacterium]
MANQPPGGYPPPYQQQYQGQGYAPRDPNALVKIMSMVVIITGYVVAGLGTLGSFFVFGIDGVTGTEQFQVFLSSLSTALGIGAIAVAAGYLLRLRLSKAT